MKRSRHKKRRAVPVPVASMGDIAFLLIIFFMLASEFAKDPDLILTPPVHEQVEKSEKTIAARVAVDEKGEIYVDGERMENAEAVEVEVRVRLSGAVSDDQRHVEFKGDRALRKEQFEPVIKAIAEAGGILEAVGDLPGQ